MPLDFKEIFLEYESSIDLLLRIPADSILRLPILKSIFLLVLAIVQYKEGDSDNSDKNDFFSHLNKIIDVGYLIKICVE